LLEIRLKPGREKSLLHKHPWIFSSAVDSVSGEPAVGETVLVRASGGEKLGLGAYSPHSNIRIRMWTHDPDVKIDHTFFYARITDAIEKRRGYIFNQDCTAYRLVFGESDGLPGLVVDQLDKVVVVQVLSAGVEANRQEIFSVLGELLPGHVLYERSDVDVRQLEGLPERTGLIGGGTLPAENWVSEYGIQYLVDVVGGQKTGFYIDQRENRRKLQSYCREKDVLNCFCYTGGFTLNALKGGARSVLSIDSSQEALSQLHRNLEHNGFAPSSATSLCGDVFVELRNLRDRAASYDVIVLDPPKFAPTVSQAEKAARGYKDINLLAFKLLRPGGVLFTFSCSGGISRELFQKIVSGAAEDAGCNVQIIDQLSQAGDHPVSLAFPESMYLKGLVCIK
jgi:23S rRNA (cytosine1962-C5)-methyltransferase